MKERARWTTPAEIEERLRRVWDRGSLLTQLRWPDDSLFPWQLKLRAPDARSLGSEFEAVRHWIRELDESSRAARGFGYDIVWTEVNHRQLGRNRLPASIQIDSLADAVALLGVAEHVQCFRVLAEHILEQFPMLETWVRREPFAVVAHEQKWPHILRVLHWLREHPRPGVYVRQLEIAGVDSKFIEANRGLLAELLDQVLPSEAVTSDMHPVRQFELRYGLRAKQPLVRFRVLDPAQRLMGLEDIATPAAQFSQLAPPITRVFITENETNGLAFPDSPASIVVFGLGYGLLRLSQVRWLSDKAVYYWGDIDTHGFAILDRLRVHLPHARSLLMDPETLMLHEALWTHEPAQHTGELVNLTLHERAVYEGLKSGVWGAGVRLEQERVAYAWVRQTLTAITG